jgi:hypothetical protein
MACKGRWKRDRLLLIESRFEFVFGASPSCRTVLAKVTPSVANLPSPAIAGWSFDRFLWQGVPGRLIELAIEQEIQVKLLSATHQSLVPIWGSLTLSKPFSIWPA